MKPLILSLLLIAALTGCDAPTERFNQESDSPARFHATVDKRGRITTGLIVDTKTGREFLAVPDCGIVEIKPVEEAR